MILATNPLSRVIEYQSSEISVSVPPFLTRRTIWRFHLQNYYSWLGDIHLEKIRYVETRSSDIPLGVTPLIVYSIIFHLT